MPSTIPQNNVPLYDAATADTLLTLTQFSTLIGSQHGADLIGVQAAAADRKETYHLAVRSPGSGSTPIIVTKGVVALLTGCRQDASAASRMCLLW